MLGWRKKKAKDAPPPRHRSPLDADRIGPGDPGWELFSRFFAPDAPDAIIATYDTHDGSIVSSREVRREDGQR